MTAARSEDGTGARVPSSDARPAGAGFAWLPDLAALAAGAAGVAAFEGAARGLCGLGVLVAVASLGARIVGGGRAERVRSASLLRAALASLPAWILLIGIVAASRSGDPGRAALAPADVSSATPEIRVDPTAPAPRDCLENEAVKTYLDALYRRLDETWQARARSDEGGFVVVGFLLDARGGVRLSRVIDRSSDAHRDSGTATLAAAAPFGPLTGELACLEAIELRATLDRTSPR